MVTLDVYPKRAEQALCAERQAWVSTLTLGGGFLFFIPLRLYLLRLKINGSHVRETDLASPILIEAWWGKASQIVLQTANGFLFSFIGDHLRRRALPLLSAHIFYFSVYILTLQIETSLLRVAHHATGGFVDDLTGLLVALLLLLSLGT